MLWAFDLGLWSATDGVTVLVAKPEVARGDDLEAIRRFAASSLALPDPPFGRPHPLALEWHRDVAFRRAA